MDSTLLGLRSMSAEGSAGFNPENLRRVGNLGGPDKLQEVRKSAMEFETSLLTAWWKEMEDTVHAFSGKDQESDTEAFSDLGAQALASGIVDRGGFGIANLLIKSMLRTDSELGPQLSRK